jgi:hypothetical protein
MISILNMKSLLSHWENCTRITEAKRETGNLPRRSTDVGLGAGDVLPELGVHADLGETGHGVDFVDVQVIGEATRCTSWAFRGMSGDPLGAPPGRLGPVVVLRQTTS